MVDESKALAAYTEPHGSQALIEVIDVSGMKAAMAAMREFVKSQLVEGVHYGKMPGVDRDFLLQSGAEQIARAFNCRPRYSNVKEAVVGKDFFMFWVKCELVNVSTGFVMGEGDGLSTSEEFMKRDGTPMPFKSSLPNCLAKAQKRAFVRATRTLGCTSEFFTQDSDLMNGDSDGEGAPRQQRQRQSPRNNTQTAKAPADDYQYPAGYVKKQEDGTFQINCPDHGWSKARKWDANEKGPANYACQKKTGDQWCKRRTTASDAMAMIVERREFLNRPVQNVSSKPEEAVVKPADSLAARLRGELGTVYGATVVEDGEYSEIPDGPDGPDDEFGDPGDPDPNDLPFDGDD